jgi:Ca-activated chloride channel family protein
VVSFVRALGGEKGGLAAARSGLEDERLRKEIAAATKHPGADSIPILHEAQNKKQAYAQAREALARRDALGVQAGKLGVDLSVQMNALRNQVRLEATARRQVLGRNCLEIDGAWIDEGFKTATPILAVKAMSDAYFRLLERHPEIKAVLQLGNRLLWIAPSGRALVIDPNEGCDQLPDDEITALFTPKG